MQGYIYLHRKLLEWDWYQDTNTKSLFIHLLLLANHKDKKWRGITIKRGQHLTSISILANETNLSQQNIRTALKHLEITNEITNESHTNYRIITLNNYDKYQKVTNDTTNKITNNQQSINKVLTTNNNDNNEINDNNYNKINYGDIVDYLNSKINSNYKSSTKITQDMIKARFNEGFTYDDFKKVIDIKSKEWLNTDMAIYLRPKTLFSNKFESYLNQKEITVKPKNDIIHPEWIDQYETDLKNRKQEQHDDVNLEELQESIKRL